MPSNFLDAALKTLAFSESSAATHVVKTVPPGRKFVIYELYLKAAGTVGVTVSSGGTAITGTIPLSVTVGDSVFHIGGHEVPALKGTGGGDLEIQLDAGESVDGFVTFALQDNRI